VASYRVFIKPSAVKEIEKIDDVRARRRIVRRIENLAAEPRPPGCEKLSGLDKFRVRQGSYRIVYSVDDRGRAVLVVKVGDRKEVYRDKK
jgi:mRNA interferase RelE/StbE